MEICKNDIKMQASMPALITIEFRMNQLKDGCRLLGKQRVHNLLLSSTRVMCNIPPLGSRNTTSNNLLTHIFIPFFLSNLMQMHQLCHANARPCDRYQSVLPKGMVAKLGYKGLLLPNHCQPRMSVFIHTIITGECC